MIRGVCLRKYLSSGTAKLYEWYFFYIHQPHTINNNHIYRIRSTTYLQVNGWTVTHFAKSRCKAWQALAKPYDRKNVILLCGISCIRTPIKDINGENICMYVYNVILGRHHQQQTMRITNLIKSTAGMVVYTLLILGLIAVLLLDSPLNSLQPGRSSHRCQGLPPFPWGDRRWLQAGLTSVTIINHPLSFPQIRIHTIALESMLKYYTPNHLLPPRRWMAKIAFRVAGAH